MKLDVVRQPLVVAFLTLLVFVAAGMARIGCVHPACESAGEVASLAGDGLLTLQARWPQSTRLLCGLALFLAGVALGRATVRYGLYSVHTYLAIPLFGLLACGIFVSTTYSVGYVAAILLVLSVRNFYAGFRNGYCFSAVFRGSLYLGALPLIYTPAVVLIPVLPLAVSLFKRSARESCVALFGFSLPFLAYSYIIWGMGGSFAAPAVMLWEAFRTPSGFSVGELPLPKLMLLGTLLAAMVFTAVCYFRDRYASGTKPRAILLFNLILFMLCTGLFFVPSGTFSAAALAAVPMATLLPLWFVRLPRPAAMCLYIGLIGLCVASLLL